jgi:integrase
MAAGIIKRHVKGCRSKVGRECSCRVSYEAWVYSPRDGRKLRRTFTNFAEARSWRADAKRQIDQGTLRAPTRQTFREAAEAWLAGAEAGEVRTRSGQPYKPSTLRGYRHALEERVLPLIGGEKLSTVTTSDLQVLVDRWQADGHPASTLRNTIKPIQAIYRRAKSRGGLPVNPTRDLELPAPRPRRAEIVAPEVAERLLTALSAEDRPIWATALYAGLRYGELRALRWGAVDVAGGTIDVRESWDPTTGAIEPKTRTSRRRVPMPAVLRELILDRRLENPSASDRALVFGSGEEDPFHAATLYRRGDATWRAAGINERLRLHQARHTYASFMIAAGVNAKALSQFMGHSSIKVTFDLYGHLMPGSEREAAGMLDAYLERASSQARLAAIEAA